jgi:7-cyano-7-deazaguanine synthase
VPALRALSSHKDQLNPPAFVPSNTPNQRDPDVTDLSKALVLFSGGQDSTICLAWALQHYEHVETVGFDYGQRHRIELDQRVIVRQRLQESNSECAAKLGDDHLLDLGLLGAISDTALTRDRAIVLAESGLPTSFVPGRNLIFVTFAAAIAYRRGIGTLVGGMCETDFSGYPDCRRDTLDALERAISLGMDTGFSLQTPLMHLDKAQTWALGEELGGENLTRITIEDTHTCYAGHRETLHPWGYGCGVCPACDLRAKGYAKWRASP